MLLLLKRYSAFVNIYRQCSYSSSVMTSNRTYQSLSTIIMLAFVLYTSFTIKRSFLNNVPDKYILFAILGCICVVLNICLQDTQSIAQLNIPVHQLNNMGLTG